MGIYQSAPGDLGWRVSRTCDGGACVQVARDGEFVIFGNTAEPNSPVLAYTRAEWKEFLAGVKLGDFDDIA
jgi:predicted secreted Zn-dependent protease